MYEREGACRAEPSGRRPQAFNVEIEGRSTNQALHDDIVSYLGEYRLNVQKYNYKLQFDGLHLRDVYNGDPLLQTAQKALLEKQNKGLPTHREVAEIDAIGSLDSQLRFVQDGTIIWASPPGPKEEGYGDYGFMFVGRKKSNSQDVEMTAIRLEHPTLSQYDRALFEITGIKTSFTNADDVLRNPFVVHGFIDETSIDSMLARNFSFALDESQEIFQRVIKDLAPSIREFMQRTKDKNILPWQKLRELRAIEHLALELKERYKRSREDNIVYLNDYRPYIPIEQLARLYADKELPRVAGSCGASAEIESNNPLSFSFKNLLKAIFEDGEKEWFTCPRCPYKASGPIGNMCPSCGLTQQRAAELGYAVCA